MLQTGPINLDQGNGHELPHAKQDTIYWALLGVVILNSVGRIATLKQGFSPYSTYNGSQDELSVAQMIGSKVSSLCKVYSRRSTALKATERFDV